MAESAKILDVRRLMSPDPQRRGKYDSLISYQVGSAPPRVILLPEETPTEAQVIAAIRADLSAASALVGKTLTVQ
jgi:hypothetical protein